MQWFSLVLHLFYQRAAECHVQLHNINPKAFHIPYINRFLIQTCSDWNDHSAGVIYLLDQNELTCELTLSSSCYPLSQLRSRLDRVKVILTVWGDLLRRSNQQNLFSISEVAEEKMDSLRIDGYWFGSFRGTKKMVSWLFNSSYLPRSNV